MRKTIDLKVVLDTLSRVREQFYDYGKEILDKISTYETTGTMSGYLGDPSFDYKDFSKVMQGGFHSVTLQLLFESMVYLHYFCDVYSMTLDPKDYISHRKFDHEAFNKISKKYADLTVDLGILETFANTALRSLGIKPKSCNKILSDGSHVFDSLKVLKYAMSVTLHHYGDYDFLVSKIPLGESHPFDMELVLNPHIFYTDKPEQIILFAHHAKPGVYVIANVPYGNHAETAFYVLFRQKGYAYLVENSKHSFRDQHYRGKSNGTAGEDAWLDRKYEECYLPVGVVMNFFEGKNESTAVKVFEGFDFVSLGKLTDGSASTVMYTYAFIDKCITFFKDNDFASQISNTSCAGFLKELLNGSTENVPAIAFSMLPAVSDFDVSWSPEKTGVKDFSGTLQRIEAELPEILNTDLSALPQGSLTSLEHLKRSVIYRNRLTRATELDYQWFKDFKKNYRGVMDRLGAFIRKRGLSFVVRKALQDRTYKLRVYPKWSGNLRKIDENGYMDVTILHGIDKKNKDEHGRTHRLTGVQQLHQPYFSNNDRSFAFDMSYVSHKLLCNHCGDTPARHLYTLQFLDWEIFREFFEIKNSELHRIPDQMKKYLNQSQTQYFGNSLLDDQDPITLIKNPWFVSVIDRDGEVSTHQRTEPAYFINFFLCGNCQRSILKG
jgi:hypothetical protein